MSTTNLEETATKAAQDSVHHIGVTPLDGAGVHVEVGMPGAGEVRADARARTIMESTAAGQEKEAEEMEDT